MGFDMHIDITDEDINYIMNNRMPRQSRVRMPMQGPVPMQVPVQVPMHTSNKSVSKLNDDYHISMV